MPVLAPSRQLKITISDPDGSNAEDWSKAWSRVELQGGSFDQGGLDIKTGSITLIPVDGNPSLNVRENRLSFRPGRLVRIEYLGSDGVTYKPLWLGRQFIRIEPPPLSIQPNQIPTLTIELTSALGYYGSLNEPDDDQSGVTSGTSTNSAATAHNLLLAGQLPAGLSNLSNEAWPYTLIAPIEKSTDNYIQQAGEIAEANHKILYENTNGLVVSQELDVTGNLPVLNLEIGKTCIDKQPAQLDSEPPDLAIAFGSKSATAENAEDNPSCTSSELIGNLATVDSSLGGIGAIEETTECVGYTYTPGNPVGATETTTKTIRRLSILISDKLSPKGQRITAEDTTIVKYFDENLRLYLQTEIVLMPAVAVWPGETTGLTLSKTAIDREIRYSYDEDGVVSKIWTIDKRCKALINSDEVDDPYTRRTYEQRVQRWVEPRPGKWSYSESLSRSLVAVDPTEAQRQLELDSSDPFNVSEFDIYKLTAVANPGTLPSYSPPPRAEEFSLPNDSTEDGRLEGQATFEHPGGPLNRTRRDEYEIKPAISVDQLSRIAQQYGAIMWGRNQGAIVEMPLSDTILDTINRPLLPFTVADPYSTPGQVTTSTFLMDSYTLVFDANIPEDNIAGCAAIWIKDTTNGVDTNPFITYRLAGTVGTVEASYQAVGRSLANNDLLIGELPETVDTTNRILLGTITING